MFDFVHKKRRIVQVILALATLPFLFWGLESYQSKEGEDQVALAAGEKILRQEFDQAVRNQKDTMRASMGAGFDDALLDKPEVRSAILEGLIQQRLLKHEASRLGLAVPDAQLVETIQNISSFQEDGKFSKPRYEELLRGQGLSPQAFEARVRQELMRQQLIAPYSESGFISDTVAERVLRLSEEKREVSLVQIRPEQFLGHIKPDDAAIKSYYDSHQAEFQLPEQIRLEYLVLSLDELIKQSHVSTDEAEKYFDEHRSEFGQPEERRASHILLSAPATAPESERAAARAKAEQLLIEIKKSPERFADLAREYSQDPGSAAKGGDLGFFARNMMVKSFEDAVFQMKMDEISKVVETDHGFHIIQLSAIKNAEPVSFDKVKGQVEQDVKKQKAEKVFGEMADEFSNMVYEQSDSLQPAAEKFGLSIQQSDWTGRNGGQPPYFTNERLLQEAFSDDVIKDKRNTEAVEVSPNTLVSARLLNYRPATTLSITELKDKISGLIARQEADKAAINEGKQKLAQLQEGKDEAVKWGATQQISRKEPHGLDNETLRAVFKADATKLPSYTGIANPQGGFTLIRVEHVTKPAPPEAAQQQAFARQLQQLIAQEELSAYLAGVRKRYEVSVSNENLEK
ncbi:SurA N-terminal domain-containing protein [Nitrosospira sp. NRS527]|uniref:SurA N-terminal domain-containing protein n=1 Tax=Nitrosospira sp. NRS527 TaxID=155925 RepID=UPI001AFC31C8|nr:SurA N-terminal domain-containing protein [Nitrosospira sp. NRS527]BCT68905.1 Peptidyl-prolyl cis-trans isomerase D [Nitrosospira sp. NRS527]